MKHLLLLALIFSCSNSHSGINEQELLRITADRKLVKDGRIFSFVVESDNYDQIQDFCLYTYHMTGEVERECYGLPYPGDEIQVVKWRKLDILTIDVIDHGVFEITYLENYFKNQHRTFRLVLLDSEGEWGLFVPQINERLRSLHFRANTRFGLPIGVRSVSYGY